MFAEQKLFDLHSVHGFLQGGELYLPVSQAFKFLEDCQHSNFAVIGIEGFTIQNEEIIPHLDVIADFSSVVSSDWKTYQATCNKAAQNFLKEMSKDERTILFNFVVQSMFEWED